MVRIHIENVVASATLADELDLQRVALGLYGAGYEPDRFPADLSPPGAEDHGSPVPLGKDCLHRGQEHAPA